MIKIKLERSEWDYDPNSPLGPPGGFGQVFAGVGVDGSPVAIKRLHIDAHDAAHRELQVAKELRERSFVHVIPFFDSGLDANSDRYYVVMPQAEQSLAQFLKSEGVLDESHAISILVEIASGLLEVPEIAHRDLKPGNVLNHAGAWKIADFGIARFVDETTSKRTLRECLTPEYAAPEQWGNERATNATDIYALACVGYELMTGSPPFKGPDYERQHRFESPPGLPLHVSPRLQSCIGSMLRKEPTVRPSTSRVLELMRAADAAEAEGQGKTALEKVGLKISEAHAQAEAAAAAEKAEQERRLRIAKAANADFRQMAKEFCEATVSHAQPTSYKVGPKDDTNNVHQLSLGSGSLLIRPEAWGEVISKARLHRSGWDVIAGAEISVGIPGYERSASLWFTNAGKGDEYRWYEVCFRVGVHNPILMAASAQLVGHRGVVHPARRNLPPHPARRNRSDPQQQRLLNLVHHAPFSCAPGPDADVALQRVATHGFMLASEPQPIDFDAKEAFFDRWHSLFALAAEGTLSKPADL